MIIAVITDQVTNETMLDSSNKLPRQIKHLKFLFLEGLEFPSKPNRNEEGNGF